MVTLQAKRKGKSWKPRALSKSHTPSRGSEEGPPSMRSRGLYLPRQEARKRTHQTQRKGSRISSKGQVASASKSSSHRSQTSDSSQGPSYFDPASLIKSKEGTFKPPRPMERYLGKHLKRCLSKEEWDALIKEHPLPDINECVPPKADKYLSDYLGRRALPQRSGCQTKQSTVGHSTPSSVCLAGIN